MCGFAVTNKRILDTAQFGKFLPNRGPDSNEIFEYRGITFAHYLLSITGDQISQPLTDSNATVVANGEIYNHSKFGNFSSDCLSIIPAFYMHGELFAQQLDGEFAIVLVDWAKNRIIMATDTFATKPLHYAIDRRHFGIASYKSSLLSMGFSHGVQVPANTILELDLTTLQVRKIGSVTEFSLSQTVMSFDPWIDAFTAAVLKRVPSREKFFIGLSSGFDSGAICLVLNQHNIPYSAYSLIPNETIKIIDERKSIAPIGSRCLDVNECQVNIDASLYHLSNDIEQLPFLAFWEDGTIDRSMKSLSKDDGAVRIDMLIKQARADGCKVYLSGHGSDEIISDYGVNGKKLFSRSNFGGKFPEDLSSIFPWPSFYGLGQQALLMREEHIAGSYGVETRYPFLDKAVVQAFLSLHPSLKNSQYKSVVNYFLKSNSYPTEFEKKIGIQLPEVYRPKLL